MCISGLLGCILTQIAYQTGCISDQLDWMSDWVVYHVGLAIISYMQSCIHVLVDEDMARITYWSPLYSHYHERECVCVCVCVTVGGGGDYSECLNHLPCFTGQIYILFR